MTIIFGKSLSIPLEIVESFWHYCIVLSSKDSGTIIDCKNKFISVSQYEKGK
ncbi:hypothetical protein BC643_1043 [Mangrovibacterium diazotrophicum]|uniref:Uncharacterized protein n=1 Tax=Mangrovibacterium diazotrophicum TaxID=1261403 RepID=A0A419W5G5_9BACT|nr:hypothetical protein BC643_1043 [Mangrovibacterium diazotrophicum]